MRTPSLVILVLALAAASASAAPTPRDVRTPDVELQLATTVTRHGTTYRRYRQEVNGIPVLEAGMVVTNGRSVDTVVDGTRRGLLGVRRPTVSRTEALKIIERTVGRGATHRRGRPALFILPVGRGRLVWRGIVSRDDPRATFEVLIDAHNGEVARTRDLLWRAEGQASLYDLNPVQANGGLAGLADAADADSALLTLLRVPRALTRLNPATMCLDGQWVRAMLPGGDVCLPPVRDFSSVTRADQRFEALMAYFHVDRAQAYLQELGFTNVVNAQTPVVANAFAEDNSLFDPTTKRIELGEGGTDDGEDADVILHEYGHAIQESQVPGFSNTGETGAMGEGFGDYFAAAMSSRFADSPTFTPCVAEWDAAGFVAPELCLRRVDAALTVSQLGSGTACAGEVHCLGQAWSGALWSLRQAIGGATMDRLVIQSHFSLTPTAPFQDGSRALLAADAALEQGVHLPLLKQVLAARGLLDVELLDDTPTDATPLTVPGVATGQLNATSDLHDVFSLDLVQGRGIIVDMTGASGNFDLRLLRPASQSASQPGAVAGGSTGPDSNEHFTAIADATGRFFLDVSAVAGSGSYRIEVQSDIDADTRPDTSDNCPGASNFGQEDRDGDATGDACDPFPDDPANDKDLDGIAAPLDNCSEISNVTQRDWDGDQVGDACDRSAKVTLAVFSRRGRVVTLRSRVFPGQAPLSAWTLTAIRRTCAAGVCRSRVVRVPRRVRVIRPGLFEARVQLPPGTYRFRARLANPRLNRAQRRLTVVIR